MTGRTGIQAIAFEKLTAIESEEDYDEDIVPIIGSKRSASKARRLCFGTRLEGGKLFAERSPGRMAEAGLRITQRLFRVAGHEATKEVARQEYSNERNTQYEVALLRLAEKEGRWMESVESSLFDDGWGNGGGCEGDWRRGGVKAPDAVKSKAIKSTRRLNLEAGIDEWTGIETYHGVWLKQRMRGG